MSESRAKLLVLLFIAIIGLVLFAYCRLTNNYWTNCEEKGGHIISRANGYLCISDDGRIIEP